MRRREFGKGLVSSAIGTGLAAAQPSKKPVRNALVRVGGDYHSAAGSGITSNENLEYSLRYGVRRLTAQLRKPANHAGWDLDELKRMHDNCDKYGVVFEAIRMDPDYITMRPGPERERELDNIVGNIQKASQVGVKLITYHWMVIPIRRNGQTQGRGSVTYAGFKLEDNWKDLPLGKSGQTRSRLDG